MVFIQDDSIFRGRYKAILIEEESYLLQVSRYIHLNSVEAGLCHNPFEYVWSSFPSFINKAKKQSWLKTDLILSHFDCGKSYNDYIVQGIDNEVKNLYRKSSSIFGSEKFIKKHLSIVSENQKIFCSSDIRTTTVIPTIQEIAIAVAGFF